MLREHSNFLIEYLPCEIMRRFACGLAYARHVVSKLLKGGFDISAHHEKCRMRSLGTIRLLDLNCIGGSGVCSRSVTELIARMSCS